MLEWILVGMMCATAILMVAHTIDEAVRSARPLRRQSYHCPGDSLRAEELASRVRFGHDDDARKRAA